MSFWDWGDQQDANEAQLGALASTGANMLEHIKGVPGAGTVISGLQGAYHTGSAVYSAMNGERDAAVSHGTQAVMAGLGMIPGVSDVMGAADSVIAPAGIAGRQVAPMLDLPGGVKAGDIPTGLSDIASSVAVGATNAIFGAEDASDNTGTRHGEVASGISGMSTFLLNTAGAPFGGSVIAPYVSDSIGEMGADFFGSSKEKGTMGGAKPGDPQSAAARAGQALHESGITGTGGNPTPLVDTKPLALPDQLIGPGGLVEDTGPAGATGQIGNVKPAPPKSSTLPADLGKVGYSTHTDYSKPPAGVSEKLYEGPGVDGISEKAGPGGGGGGPMPQLPWFLEPVTF